MARTADEESLESAMDGSTAAWAVERAEELDLEPHEFLDRIMQAYRAAEQRAGEDGTDAGGSTGSVGDLEAEFTDLLEDVRERVIQVKRETDAKAPVDHEHAELEAGVQSVRSDLESIEIEVASLEERLAGGFENFEAIIEYLLDRTDAIGSDLQTLGSAVVSLEERVEQITAREQARARADRIKQRAAQHGVRTARCESCSTKLDLAMLSDATCPTCEAVFRDLEVNTGFFGTSTLETGSRPALEGPSDVPDTDDLVSVASGGSGSSERPDWSTESGPEPDEMDDEAEEAFGEETEEAEVKEDEEGDDDEE